MGCFESVEVAVVLCLPVSLCVAYTAFSAVLACAVLVAHTALPSRAEPRPDATQADPDRPDPARPGPTRSGRPKLAVHAKPPSWLTDLRWPRVELKQMHS